MKGSTNMAAAAQPSGGQQGAVGTFGSPRNYWSSPGGQVMQSFLGFHMPSSAMSALTGGRMAGSGSKGSVLPQPQPQTPPRMTTPGMPEYTNYQQTPSYMQANAGPSEALTRFLNSGYASGGAAKASDMGDLEQQIEDALRIARLIGELTKKM
jgi:hypothetical protein